MSWLGYFDVVVVLDMVLLLLVALVQRDCLVLVVVAARLFDRTIRDLLVVGCWLCWLRIVFWIENEWREWATGDSIKVRSYTARISK